jgi:hypothetical protein
MSRPPLPPFTKETAAQNARMAEDAWNWRERVALAPMGALKAHRAKPSSIALTPDGAAFSFTVEIEIARAQTARRSGEIS